MKRKSQQAFGITNKNVYHVLGRFDMEPLVNDSQEEQEEDQKAV